MGVLLGLSLPTQVWCPFTRHLQNVLAVTGLLPLVYFKLPSDSS